MGKFMDFQDYKRYLQQVHRTVACVSFTLSLLARTSVVDFPIRTRGSQGYKTVLRSEKAIEKSKLYDFFQPWLGKGLFTAPEKIWRVHRKLIGPTFNLKILESFVAVFAAQSNVMVKKMEAELNGAEFPVFDYVSKCTLDIICETTMGVSMRAQIKNDCSYVEAAEKTFAIVYQRMFKVWLHPSAIFNRTQLGTEQNKHINTMHNFTNNVIQRKKKSLLNKTAVSGEDNEDKQNGRNHGSSGGLFFPYVFLLHGVSPVVFNI
nr:cytochrome P450 4C1-like isoform X2 [Neodiprion pinetum]